MDEPEVFTLFWDGPFSQWYPCYFEIDDVEYNCAEQFMMAEKARLFQDWDTLEMIMDSESPATQKALGRAVDGFEEARWQSDDTHNDQPVCWNIVWRGNVAKFSQNDYLYEILCETSGTTLVEASPVDTIWGIGLGQEDPRCHHREAWRGMNWLGEVLTEVREYLKKHPELREHL